MIKLSNLTVVFQLSNIRACNRERVKKALLECKPAPKQLLYEELMEWLIIKDRYHKLLMINVRIIFDT